MLPGSNGGIRVPVVYGVALARSNTVALPLADDDTDVCTGWSGVRQQRTRLHQRVGQLGPRPGRYAQGHQHHGRQIGRQPRERLHQGFVRPRRPTDYHHVTPHRRRFPAPVPGKRAHVK
jgi:hypothetical protein